MVRVGNHSLELVSFETGQTLQEFYSNGSTWVEGIPGNQYLIKITSHESGTLTMAHSIKIDGSDIGYLFQQGPWSNLSATLGAVPASGAIAFPEDPSHSCRAFCFARPNFRNKTGFASSGLVEVTWSEASDLGTPREFFSPSPWTESTTAAIDSKKEGVGSLKSTTGTSSLDVPMARTHWAKGKHLYTISIRYCELAGLVARGIVKAPMSATIPASTDGRKKSKADRGVGNVDVKVEVVVDLTGL